MFEFKFIGIRSPRSLRAKNFSICELNVRSHFIIELPKNVYELVPFLFVPYTTS